MDETTNSLTGGYPEVVRNGLEFSKPTSGLPAPLAQSPVCPLPGVLRSIDRFTQADFSAQIRPSFSKPVSSGQTSGLPADPLPRTIGVAGITLVAGLCI